MMFCWGTRGIWHKLLNPVPLDPFLSDAQKLGSLPLSIRRSSSSSHGGDGGGGGGADLPFISQRILAQSVITTRAAGMEAMAELLEKQLTSEISKMTLDEAFDLACAFSYYLNLMGITETHHMV